MGKTKQRNWLLIITGVLLISTILVLFISTKRELGIGVCFYDGITYEQNQTVPNYQGRNDCYCSWSGEIVCEEQNFTVNYESFTTDGLLFRYDFRNFLDKVEPEYFKITLSDINYREEGLEMIIEREVLCTETSLVPTQLGMYELGENSVVLTSITSIDEMIHTNVCVISNTFLIANIDTSKKDEYSIMYQNEKGQLFDLNTCFVNGRLYAPEDVFKDSLANMLCTCEGPEVECEKL